MSVSEQIEQYFEMMHAEKKLKPGDKLPNYAELCKMFGITYVTAQRAFKKLEQKGMIKIVHGVGSFLNGADQLNVDLYLNETSFDFTEMQKIVDEISKSNYLHLNFSLKPMLPYEIKTNTTEHKVVITEASPWVRTTGNLMDFSGFSDYNDLYKSFDSRFGNFNNYQLPFYCFTYQGGVNTAILRKIGFSKEITRLDTLGWWDELVEKCRLHGELPAFKSVQGKNLWNFSPYILSMLLMLQEGRKVEELFKHPFYETPCGKRVFDIMDTWAIRKTDSLWPLGAAVNLDIGSWITVQYEKIYHISDDAFQMVPLMLGNQKILRCNSTYLQIFLNNTVSENEKKRIWEFLKHLVSKKYQRKICGMIGGLSFRKDMNIRDYFWATRKDFCNFLPSENDLFIEDSCLSKEQMAVLGALYDQHAVYGIESSIIRKAMDEKLQQ